MKGDSCKGSKCQFYKSSNLAYLIICLFFHSQILIFVISFNAGNLHAICTVNTKIVLVYQITTKINSTKCFLFLFCNHRDRKIYIYRI
ncbi:hypothetical protein C2G38_2085340 [Gigaspora rosea]|uniref:Uncharacterized protein n=1 Tax=Gigaspora rosea TaxID=44941 RepID=A0A397V9I0_9GLOM|nr:hypothetical protein C2G38_2085340 [Gigaspora rosea]